MVVVNRRTFIAKRGHPDEVLAMLKQEESSHVKRVYRSHYGAFDAVAMELEFSTIAEMEEAWNEWYLSDNGKKFMPIWETITENGGTNEVWLLE